MSNETLARMYELKGELVTQIEIAQAKLQQVNQEIITTLNKDAKAAQKES